LIDLPGWVLMEMLRGIARWCRFERTTPRRSTMLGWSLIFLVIAIIAAVLGFGGIAGTAAGIAKVLFVVFLAIWIISLVIGRRGR